MGQARRLRGGPASQMQVVHPKKSGAPVRQRVIASLISRCRRRSFGHDSRTSADQLGPSSPRRLDWRGRRGTWGSVPAARTTDGERLAERQPYDDVLVGPAPSEGLPRCPRRPVAPARSKTASPGRLNGRSFRRWSELRRSRPGQADGGRGGERGRFAVHFARRPGAQAQGGSAPADLHLQGNRGLFRMDKGCHDPAEHKLHSVDRGLSLSGSREGHRRAGGGMDASLTACAR